MRLGIVTGEYPPMQGGVGAFSRILAQTFAGMRHEVFVLSSKRAGTRFPGVMLTNHVERWGPGSLRTIRQWADAKGLDLVNLQFQTAAFGMSPWIHFLPRFVDVPVVTTFHDLRHPYLFPKAGLLRDWVVMDLARRSAGVIVTNHEDLQRVQALSRVALIPIGSNILPALPGDFDRHIWREQAGADGDDDLLLAHFGFVNQSKGLETLLESVATLRAGGQPVRLVMVGGRTGASDLTNRDYAKWIESQIEALGLTTSIHWTGYVDDETVSAYLVAADIVTLPFLDGASYRRGSLMAAIQHGCAIITTTPQIDIPAFKAGENMLLVPPEDADALVDAIHRLHHAPHLRERLQTGAKALSNQFEWEEIAADSIQFFRQIIGGRA